MLPVIQVYRVRKVLLVCRVLLELGVQQVQQAVVETQGLRDQQVLQALLELRA